MTLEDAKVMRFTTQGLAALLLLALAGCASKGDLQFLQRDTDELKTRYLNMEKDFAGLKSETREGMDKSLKEYQKEIAVLRKGTAELQAALDSARVDMQVMAGKVDDSTLLAKKPAEDIAFVKENMERRLTASETSADRGAETRTSVRSHHLDLGLAPAVGQWLLGAGRWRT